MSAIVHRCVTCGHIEQYHDQHLRGTEVGCSYSWCASGRHVFQPGPSELIPTITAAGISDWVVAPGAGLAAQESGSPNPFGSTCACDECQLLYTDVAVAA